MSWNVKQLTDKDQILSYLETDRLFAAYAVGDLEPELFQQGTWFGAEKNGRLCALVMHFRGVKMPVLFLMGDTDGVRAVLENGMSPESVYINCRAEHLTITRDIYMWDEPIAMWRMVLNKERFQPVKNNCVRLTPDHADQLMELYEHGGMAGFNERQLDRGIFYGIFHNGRMAAAAGTHLISTAYNIAALGNVFTHQDHRGCGYGTATVNAVLTDLTELGIRDIVLNVGQVNGAAIHIYEKSGFERYCPFLEGEVSLRKSDDKLAIT